MGGGRRGTERPDALALVSLSIANACPSGKIFHWCHPYFLTIDQNDDGPAFFRKPARLRRARDARSVFSIVRDPLVAKTAFF